MLFVIGRYYIDGELRRTVAIVYQWRSVPVNIITVPCIQLQWHIVGIFHFNQLEYREASLYYIITTQGKTR